MEAMWTRFQPLARTFKKVLEDGNLGHPVSIHADLSVDFGIESACVISPFSSRTAPDRTYRSPDEP